ncbi:hypothetical protein SAICODRAFT_73611 [Saitoella complicata NRRL Y-17804]|nr:uncharacterized protein SAICODRAFT_73611 [Saitoella complicata NRRL Y-17804]ODQ50077.1 hypothetical protein SAICODRAFT_73611 [Saitoella complicata NRRL Y-17804]
MTTQNTSLPTSAESGSTPSPLDSLLAQASKLYALRSYPEAADKFAEAAALSAEIHGEGSVENADVLFLYGRALFHVAVERSEVLGGAAPGAGEDDDDEQEEEDDEEVKDDGEQQHQEEETPKDDFEQAWELLDLARVLYTKTLITSSTPTTTPGDITPSKFDESTRSIRERLAETYDLLGEVSLESENFDQAVLDLTSALEYKQALYGEEEGILSEAYFKLGLAYEFASGEGSRAAAIENISAAVANVKTRLSSSSSSEEKKKQLSENLKDLEAKLEELRTEPSNEDEEKDLEGLRSGIRSALEGVPEVKDLSGLVRKKKKVEGEAEEGPASKKAKVEEA